MRIFLLKNKEILENLAAKENYNFYLNEMLGASLRLAPAGPRKSASKIAPDDFVRKNLAVNPERSPLTHSFGYGSACDRPALFARFPLIFVPFTQFAG